MDAGAKTEAAADVCQVGADDTIGRSATDGVAILRNEPLSLRRWISSTEHIKPGVHMPAFGMLPDDDLGALAAYLHGLK